MAKVPQYGAPKVQSKVVNMPQARALPSGAFGSTHLANALEAGADIASGIHAQKQAYSTTTADQALVNFEREKNNLLFSADGGYFNTNGINAYDGRKDINTKLSDLQRRYIDTLDDDNARTLFQEASNQQLTRAQLDIERHGSKGLEAAEMANFSSNIENTIENASYYYTDDNELNIQHSRGRLEVLDRAKLQGITGEALNEELQTYDSSFYSAAVSAATNSSSAMGDKLLNKYRDRIEGPDIQNLESNLTKKKEQERDQFLNTESVAKAQVIVDQNDSRTAINDQIDKIKDVELRKKTRIEVDYRLKQQKYAKQEFNTESFNAADDFILRGGSPTEWALQNPEARESLTAVQWRKLTTGASIETDWDTFNNLMSLPTSRLAGVDVTNYTHRLAPAQRNTLASAVNKARRGEKDSIGQNRSQMLKSFGVNMFGKTGDWSNREREQYNSLSQLVSDEVTRREADTGKVVQADEYKSIINDIVRENVQEGAGWFGFDRTTELDEFDVETQQALGRQLRTANIPITIDSMVELNDEIANNRDQLERALESRNIPVTADNLARLYLQSAQGMVADR